MSELLSLRAYAVMPPSLPDSDAELTPAQLRTLAAALLDIADGCEGRPISKIPSLNRLAYPLNF